VEVVTRLDGAIALGLERLVDLGYFKTRSEVVRAGVLALIKEYNLFHNSSEVEAQLAIAKVNRLDSEVDAGKRKLVSLSDALAKSHKKR